MYTKLIYTPDNFNTMLTQPH